MTSTDQTYAGTDFTFSELNALPRHRRNEALAASIFHLDKLIEPLQSMKDEAERWLKQDAIDQGDGTSVIDAGDYEVSVLETPRYQYDVEGLTQLLGFGVSQEQFDAAIQRTWKVDKNWLNKLVKRGGRIKQIIDQNTRRHVIGRKLTVKLRATVDRPEPNVYDDPGDRTPLDLD